ncbi:Rv2175c family DNA-binding protein [Amnibacterium endophyticum]|uniref:Rv2175c family DNA-binding protein n=1 Tax=Amnibacterium endophyticum TaxID=2109337 RepID=A0ABW4LC28_9MICO
MSERVWLTVPDVAERLDLTPSRVRRLIEDRHLLAQRQDGVLRIPEVFLTEDGPLPELRGTVVLLGDSGFGDDEAVTWLLEPEDSLGAAPIDALLAGRKAEVRRVAQALAF